MKPTAFIIFFAVVAIAAASQAPAQKPAFEVISVKPTTLGIGGGTSIGTRGNLFDAPNVTLRMVLQYAYLSRNGVLQSYEIIGGPSWMDGPDRFDIQARLANDSRSLPDGQVQLMVQSLLEERFQLKAHREMGESPVYNLVVDKGGLKMKLADDQTAPSMEGLPVLIFNDSMPLSRGAIKIIRSISPSGALSLTLSGSAVPVSRLVDLLQPSSDRRIFDNTGLKTLFDFRLQFAPQQLPNSATSNTEQQGAASDPAGPSLMDALEHQLGLKLESSKAPLEVLVIDSVSKPSEN